MKTYKLTVFVILLTFLSLSLAACGSSNANPENANEAENGGTQTISVETALARVEQR